MCQWPTGWYLKKTFKKKRPWTTFSVNIGFLGAKHPSALNGTPHEGDMQTREDIRDLLLLEWMHVWTPLLRQRKKWKNIFEVGWQIPLVLRLFDVLHPGKLRLRQGRWNLSELDSLPHQMEQAAAGHPLSRVLSLHTCVHVRAQAHVIRICSHTQTDTHRHCVLRFCMHLLLLSLCR